MADYVKRLQSRLAHKNLSLSKTTLIEKIEQLGYDPQSLVASDVDALTALLISAKNTNEVVEMSEDNSVEVAAQPAQEAIIHVSEEEKRSQIIKQSEKMGVALTQAEVNVVAETVSSNTTSRQKFVVAIKKALLAFVESKATATEREVDTMLQEVTDFASERFQEVDTKLVTSLQSFAQQMREQEEFFQIQATSWLEVFRV